MLTMENMKGYEKGIRIAVVKSEEYVRMLELWF